MAGALTTLAAALGQSRAADAALATAQADARRVTLAGLVQQANTGDWVGAIGAARLAGYSADEMATAYRAANPGAVTTAQTIIDYARQQGIPGFAMGGIATGPALVGEGQYNEAVVPLPNGRSIPVSLSGDAMAELIREVRALRDDVRAGDAGIITVGTRAQRTLDRWDREGLPPERVE